MLLATHNVWKKGTRILATKLRVARIYWCCLKISFMYCNEINIHVIASQPYYTTYCTTRAVYFLLFQTKVVDFWNRAQAGKVTSNDWVAFLEGSGFRGGVDFPVALYYK